MKHLHKFLSRIQVKLSDLLLDANNPRFSELGEELNPIPETRFAESKVQESTYAKMKDPLFDVKELRDTIKTLGFLPMDRMVVKRWKGSTPENTKYIVIEGNRRLTAVKWLIELHEVGKETLSEDELENLSSFECLLLDDSVAPDAALTILPGLRHVSGIKEWGAYQKAKAIFALRKNGMSPQEVAQSLGLSTRAANAAYRCFLALEQMKSDEEFGEYAEPRMYSYFEEVFKKRNVKEWLGWDEDEGRFANEDNVVEFYSWLVPEQDTQEAKLPTALSIRDLSMFIDDDTALNIFRAKEGSLSRALAKYEIDHPADWYPMITAAIGAVKSLTPDALRTMQNEFLDALVHLREKIDQALRDREKLIKE